MEKDYVQQEIARDCGERPLSEIPGQTDPVQPRSDRRKIPGRPGEIDTRVSTERGDRDIRRPRAVHLTILCSEAKGKDPTNSGSETLEHVLRKGTFQDGGDSHREEHATRGRLDDKDRLERRIPVSSPGRRGKEIHWILVEGDKVSIQCDALWIIISSTDIHQADESRHDSIEGARAEISILPGRHSDHVQVQGGSTAEHREGDRSPRGFGVDNKPEEECERPQPEDDIPGIPAGLVQDEDLSARGKGAQDYPGSQESKQAKESANEKARSSGGDADLPSLWVWSKPDTSTVAAAQHCSVPEPRCPMGPQDSDIQRDSERAQMVDSPSIPLEREDDCGRGSDGTYLYRCLEIWMGSLLTRWLEERLIHSRPMEYIGPRVLKQLSGTKSHSGDPEGEPEEVAQEASGDTFGQHHRDCSGESTEQSQTPTPPKADKEHMEPLSEGEDYLESRVRSRSGEPDGRLVESDQLGPRVEPRSTDVSKDSEGDGTDDGRPLCDPGQQKTREILLAVPGGRSPGHRRTKGRVMGGKRVREPSPNPDKPNIETIEAIEDIPGLSDSILAVPSLVGGMPTTACQEAKAQGAEEHGQSKREKMGAAILASSRLEAIREAWVKQGIAEREIQDLLAAAERDSTSRTYDSVWRMWEAFCRGEGRDPKAYDMGSALRFLRAGASKGRSRNYLKLMRSVLSETWRALHPEEVILSQTVLCQRLMKGIRENCPGKPRKHQTWDVARVLSKLREIDTSSADMRLVSKKTAMLLALATFWRTRSDLSRIRLEDVTFNSEGGLELVVTKPKEGDFKQTTLFPYSDEALCAVRCTEIYLERTRALRTNTRSLFVTFRRPHGDASGDTIARWVKQLLKEAGIDARPHSTRSAITSEAWLAGVSLQKIMEKANWRNASTFKTFYLRPPTKIPIGVHIVNEVHDWIDESEKMKFIYECTSSHSERELPTRPPLETDCDIQKGRRA